MAWGGDTKLRGVELRAVGIGELGLQPDTKHRTMVVFTTINAANMKRVRLNMRFIIPERESLVNTGFAGNGEGIR